jgi:lipopolysaccharide export system permease protein
MKIIDRFVLTSFIRPFIVTFFVMILFLLMQFVWKYIDDLAGRGVEWYYIAELLFYTSATVVPMALPLAVLLSSIMVLGSMGENNELAALKSSGQSLLRVMRPLIYFMLFLGIAAFLFANYVIPVANYKSESLRKNISNSKPALSIQPGVFYAGIEGYSIKVGDKFGPNQSELRDVIIYDHTGSGGNEKVIVAQTGKMQVTPDERFLVINLYQGHVYEDYKTKKRQDRDNHPFVNTSFKESTIRFSLSEFKKGDLRETGRKDYDMLNIHQLYGAVDSLKEAKVKRQTDFTRQMRSRYSFSIKDSLDPKTIKTHTLSDSILSNFKTKNQARIVQNALRIARSSKAYFNNADDEYNWRDQIITRHVLEWWKKYSVSFSVVVLFFVGAPLGAIIRKGGMGMPVVVSVVIFIIYHVGTTSFEKLGRHMVWDPPAAMWTANLILLPIGFWLTYKSATDSVIFNAELYLKPFQKIASYFGIAKKKSGQ